MEVGSPSREDPDGFLLHQSSAVAGPVNDRLQLTLRLFASTSDKKQYKETEAARKQPRMRAEGLQKSLAEL